MHKRNRKYIEKRKMTDQDINRIEYDLFSRFPIVDCPVRNYFTPGLYVRERLMPKGAVVTSMIHKTEHVFTISKGLVGVSVNGEELEIYKAPYTGITKPGTRRILFIFEDTIWTTYHPNPENITDQDKLDEMLVDWDNPLLKEEIEKQCHTLRSQLGLDQPCIP